MSLINYNEMATFTDKRIIKSRKCIFETLIQLLKEKPLISISVTELCRAAVINRKTFYSQYDSIFAAFEDLEKHIILGYLSQLRDKEILKRESFKPSDFIIESNRIIEEHRDQFETLSPYFGSGNFMRQLGAILGQFAIHDPKVVSGSKDQQYLACALVFAVSGLINCLLDWIALGRQIPIEELAQIAEQLMNHPLSDYLN